MKKIKMYYNDSLDVYVYIFVDRSAKVKVWSDIVCTYVQEDGRDIAAMALKGMRREKMNPETGNTKVKIFLLVQEMLCSGTLGQATSGSCSVLCDALSCGVPAPLLKKKILGNRYFPCQLSLETKS